MSKNNRPGFMYAENLSDALNTGVNFPTFKSLEESRENSIKQESPKIYDRYEGYKYHSPYERHTSWEPFFDKIKVVMRKLKLYND